jgi:hypothetical protein
MDETAVLDVPAETTATETPVEQTLEQTSQTDKTESTQPGDRTDNRQVPDAIRKTLKGMRENPETKAVAETFAKSLNENKSYKNFFPTVGEAKQAKQALEAIGGAGKIAELQQSGNRMREVDALIESGDKSAVPVILESPEARAGIVKLLPDLLEELGKTHSKEIQGALKSHSAQFLDSEGFPDALDEMVAIFKGPGTAEEKLARMIDIRGKMANWFRSLGARQQSQDPEREAFQRERQTWEQTRFQESVSSAFNAVLSDAQTKIVAKLKGDAQKLGADADLQEIWLRDIWKIIETRRNADNFFTADVNSKFNERTKKVSPDAAQWAIKFTDQYLDEAYRRVMGPRLRSVTPQPAKKTVATTAPNANPPEIDMQETLKRAGSRDAMRDSILAGKAFAKGGKPIKKVGRVWSFA